MLDAGNITTTRSFGFESRAIINGVDEGSRARTRLIIIAILLLVAATIPSLIKLGREFNNLLAYRRRWVAVKCEGVEMGWLSAEDAPGLKGWGEGAVKEFFAKNGLSSTLDGNTTPPRRRRRDHDVTPSASEFDSLQGGNVQDAVAEVDVQGLFTVA